MGKSKKRRHRWRIRLEYACFSTVRYLLQALPISLAFALGDLLAATAFILDFRHRRRAISHLRHAGIAANHAQARTLAWRNFRHYGRLVVEIAQMRQFICPENIREHIQVTGDPAAAALFFHGRNGLPPSPAIVITAHYGNWELAGMGYALLSGHRLTTIIRQFDNPLINHWFHRNRQCFGHQVQEKSGALKPLLGALKRGESVCILADQHAGRGEGLEVAFFGHPARTHASPALLHLHTGVPILVACSRRIPGQFQFEFALAPPIRLTPGNDKDADVRHLVQAYTSALEDLIRQDPVQWLWTHRRWLDINRRQDRYPTATTDIPHETP